MTEHWVYKQNYIKEFHLMLNFNKINNSILLYDVGNIVKYRIAFLLLERMNEWMNGNDFFTEFLLEKKNLWNKELNWMDDANAQ